MKVKYSVDLTKQVTGVYCYNATLWAVCGSLSVWLCNPCCSQAHRWPVQSPCWIWLYCFLSTLERLSLLISHISLTLVVDFYNVDLSIIAVTSHDDQCAKCDLKLSEVRCILQCLDRVGYYRFVWLQSLFLEVEGACAPVPVNCRRDTSVIC